MPFILNLFKNRGREYYLEIFIPQVDNIFLARTWFLFFIKRGGSKHFYKYSDKHADNI